MSKRMILTAVTMVGLFASMMLIPQVSRSVPSFARQTELACSNCHTVFPELNSFGRLFKLQGYTLSSEAAIESKGADKKTDLRLPKIPPFSAMVQTSYTHLNTAEPDTRNGVASFPQEFSFFFAGEITPKLGGFVQLTWDDEEQAFGVDLMDFRFSHQTTLGNRNFIFGLTLNNTPTVQDVWNSTAAWGFPYAGSSSAPTPGAAPMLAGGLESLEQSFVGLGAYSLYNHLVYTEFTMYRTTHNSEDAVNQIKNFAPYWRVALQHQWPSLYLSAGTYGMAGKYYPVGITGDVDHFTDIGIDGQCTAPAGSGTLTAHTTWIHETRNLEATFANSESERQHEKLDMFKFDANYYYRQRYGISLGYFSTTGDGDSLLYAPGDVSGFSDGKPNSSGLIMELDYLPWLNTKLGLQYIVYDKFNGAKDNYDGSGRNASDNNTLFLSAWFAM